LLNYDEISTADQNDLLEPSLESLSSESLKDATFAANGLQTALKPAQKPVIRL
jgi:hypothetical protein